MGQEYRKNLQRLEAWLDARPGPWGVVVDIGTRAARVIVGPKELPRDDWHRRLFFNDSLLTDLGAEVDRFDHRLDPSNPVFQMLLDFVGTYRTFLDGVVDEQDFTVLGTAVFRWLDNLEEIQLVLQEHLGLPLRVLGDHHEALYATASITQTHGFRRRRGDSTEIRPEDAILLLDQGGGSMEISYTFPSHPQRFEVHSLDRLGTVALRERFFSMGATGGLVEPSSNHRSFEAQHARVLHYIHEQLDAWGGYPALHDQRVHAYAMGSAITEALKAGRRGGMSNHAMHNRVLTRARLEELIAREHSFFRENHPQVASIYQGLLEEESSRDRHLKNPEVDLGKRLAMLYGLTAYHRALKRLGLRRLRVCGYGLRYGVFVWRYVWNKALL